MLERNLGHRRCFVVAAMSLTMLLATAATSAQTSVLFIGNSFTFGYGSAARFYRADTVTDLNHHGVGGMPALFRSFADQAGLDFDVFVETQPGSGLDFHLENKRGVIGRRGWDVVVMHGYSTLDPDKPRDPAKLIDTSVRMAAFLRERNPDVAVHLLATWSRADQTLRPDGAWAGEPIDAMASDVRAAYDAAADAADAAAVIAVGEAWTRAIESGVADPNPYDGIGPDMLDLWSYDHYHASVYGTYLEALVVFGTLTRLDPRVLGENECSAFELGISRMQARALQQIAYEQLDAERDIDLAPMMLSEPTMPQRCMVAR